MSNPLAPLTWKNIDAPNPSQAAYPMALAGQAINAGFGNLKDVLGGVEKTALDNWDTVKNNNTAEYLTKLASYKTPEELQAARDAGELDVARHGAQIDQDKTRNADTNQLNLIRDSILKGQAYDSAQTLHQYEPVNHQMALLAAGGKREELEAMIAANGGNPLNADHMKALVDYETGEAKQALDERRVKATEASGDREQQMLQPRIDEIRASIKNNDARTGIDQTRANNELIRANTDASRVQQETLRAQAAAQAKATEISNKAKADAYERLRTNSGMSSGTLDTEEGKKAFVDALKIRNVSPNQVDDILYNLNKYYADGGIETGTDKNGKPIKMPLTVSDALKAVEQSTENPIAAMVPGWSRRGDDFVNILENRFGKNSKSQDKGRIDEIKAVLQADRDRLSPLGAGFVGEAQKKSSELSGIRDTIGTQAGGYVPFSYVPDAQQRQNLQIMGHAVASVEGGDYNKLVGGKSFSGYDQHPGIVGMVTKDGPSTAAGRYQITGTTAKDVGSKIGISDFSPKSQDQAFTALLARNGALEDVMQGNFDAAMQKIGGTWQGVPSGTSTNQGKRTMEQWQAALNEGKAAYGAVPSPVTPAQSNVSTTPVAQLAPAFARPGDDKTTPSASTNLAINGNGAATTTTAQVTIPKDVTFKPAVTAVDGTNNGGNRTILTFAPNTASKQDGQLRKYGADKTKVTDGDGIDFTNDDGSKLVCRLDSIDAPEVAHMAYGKPDQEFGERAKKTLKDMIENKEVTVRISQAEGRYGRSYCQVEVEGQGVDKQMLQKGAAWLYRTYVKDPAKLAELSAVEADAKANKRGLWFNPEAENPETFRHRH